MSEALMKVRKARSAVVQSAPFFGSLLLRQKLIETMEVETMSTNGKELFFNPTFVMETPSDELQGVNAHEALHPAMNHHTRRGNRDPDLWNEACDYSINPVLIRAGFHLPKTALVREDFAGMSAEKIYDVLKREKEQQQQDQKQQQGDGSQQGQQQQKPGSKDHGGTGNFTDAPGADTSEGNAKEEREWRTALTQAINLAGGSVPADIAAMAREILEPKAPWRELLRRYMDQFAKQDYSWQQPNRRFIADGLYLPSMKSEQMPAMLVCIDASGSMPQETLKATSNELQAIIDELMPERVDVLIHNTRINEVRSFEPYEEIDFTAKASGGTKFAPVCDFINDAFDYACVVWFTDLMASDWSACKAPATPILWVDYLGRREAEFGDETVIIEEAA